MTLRVTYRLSSTEAEEANSWLSSSALSRCQSLKSYCPQSRPMRCRVEPAVAVDGVVFKLGRTSLFVNPAVVWVGLARPNPRLQRTPLRAPLSHKPLGGLGARSDAREGAAGDAVKSVGARNLSVSRHRDHHVPPGTRTTSFSRPVRGSEDHGANRRRRRGRELPPRALGHVMEWWSLHRGELAENWRLAQEGRQPKAIAPLE